MAIVLHLSKKVTPQDSEAYTLKAHYIYWWVGKNISTPHSLKRILLSALNNIFKNTNDRWAYPSVMVYSLANDKNAENEARQRGLDFIKEYAPTFQKSLGAIE